MGYSEALEAAGAKVIEYKEFGSYQGDWLAFVEYNGEKGIVEGSYGSCSGCDAFEAEFGWTNGPTEKDGKYYRTYWHEEDNEIPKEEFDKINQEIQVKLADFGSSYLVGGVYGKDHYENRLANLKSDDWFDQETKELCEWAISRDWD